MGWMDPWEGSIHPVLLDSPSLGASLVDVRILFQIWCRIFDSHILFSPLEPPEYEVHTNYTRSLSTVLYQWSRDVIKPPDRNCRTPCRSLVREQPLPTKPPSWSQAGQVQHLVHPHAVYSISIWLRSNFAQIPVLLWMHLATAWGELQTSLFLSFGPTLARLTGNYWCFGWQLPAACAANFWRAGGCGPPVGVGPLGLCP